MQPQQTPQQPTQPAQPVTAQPVPQPTGELGGIATAPPNYQAQTAPPQQGVVTGGAGVQKGLPATAPRNPNSSQNSLLIAELRDSMTIMNDGSMRAVIACQSINFDLMSDREREAVEYSYQNFLNSLYFPIQIMIRSQKVDIGPYLDLLERIRRDQDNMLLGVLMDDYISFIGALAQETNIMDKSFFIVVPYYPSGDMSGAINQSKNMLGSLFGSTQQQRIRIDEATYNKSKDEIRNRVQTVVNGLLQIGIRSSQLNTKELGELYYNVYNPDTAVREPLGDFNTMNAPIITKGQGQAPQPHLDREVM
jgi:type IV secretory pathway VirB4 component